MPITRQSLATVPYDVGAAQIVPAGTVHRNEHIVYTLNSARVNVVDAPNAGIANLRTVTGTLNAAGTAVYLPYEDNKITSVRLPVPAPATVNFFYTANLSGCKFYVDRIAHSNDLMVYHANTHAHAAPPHGVAANYQAPNAVADLDAMHTGARADYAGLHLRNKASIGKGAYYQAAAQAEQRKAGQGRTLTLPGHGVDAPLQHVQPEFNGGCTIVGFFTHGSWRFYYQTWGTVDYDRSTSYVKALVTFHWKYIHKKRTLGKRHSWLTDIRVVDHGRIR